MSGGRNRRARAGIFAADAGAKNSFNRSRFDVAISEGELLADISGQLPFHLGPTRFVQQTNYPITRGNPRGFLDLDFRTGKELSQGLTGNPQVGGGIFLGNAKMGAEAASIIFEQLGRSDPDKAAEFKNEFLTNTGAHTDGGRGFLSGDFKFTGTSANRLPPIQNSVARGARARLGVGDPTVADATQEGKKRKNLGESRGGTLLTGNAGLSDSANTTKKTLLG
jgi:hypothetical protein